jgi:photosystem II stability/assembly factor-like uncharacterized protein
LGFAREHARDQAELEQLRSRLREMPEAGAKKRQHPQQRQTTPTRPSRLLLLVGAAGLIGLAVFGIVLARGSGADETGEVAAPLPNTSDYHSLLVAPNAPDQLVLGTHQGLFRSADGGRSWTQAELANQDAMNLARSSSTTVWAAGHNVFARSRDGGSTWQDLQPTGLPSLDLHGFAVDAESDQLWAAVAGEGLYRSDDGGASFSLITEDVGGGVMGLEVLPGGRLLAADMQQEALLASEDGGRTWSRPLERPVMAIAAAPGNPKLLLASILGTDAGIVRSADGGQSWNPVLSLPEGAGPIAWSESEPTTAYVVSLDRTLFRSTDAGASWQQVTEEAS